MTNLYKTGDLVRVNDTYPNARPEWIGTLAIVIDRKTVRDDAYRVMLFNSPYGKNVIMQWGERYLDEIEKIG